METTSLSRKNGGVAGAAVADARPGVAELVLAGHAQLAVVAAHGQDDGPSHEDRGRRVDRGGRRVQRSGHLSYGAYLVLFVSRPAPAEIDRDVPVR